MREVKIKKGEKKQSQYKRKKNTRKVQAKIK
jgi:hypothetical protein